MNSWVQFYQIHGWTETHRGITPTIEDFIEFGQMKIDLLGYEAKSTDGFQGIFRARFESLLRGTRSLTFNVYNSKPNIEKILTKPMVFELGGLINDNEKSLIFNIILKKLYLYLQNLGFSSQLKHLTVIEEAHRLLSSSSTVRSDSSETIKDKAQGVFGDILAEIRAFGEGIIVVEQKPKQLIDSVITNTNLKICHKLPSIDQFYHFKDSIALLNEHLPFITKLKPGECVLKIEEVDQPFFIQANIVKDEDWGLKDLITDESLRIKKDHNPFITQLDYTIAKNNEDQFLLNISKIAFLEDNKEAAVKNPTKEKCLEFPNFWHVLWNRMKNFYSTYGFCPKCFQIAKKHSKCPHCTIHLEDIEELHLERFHFSSLKESIVKSLKYDKIREEYLKSYFPLFPSGSNPYSKIKQEYLDLFKTKN